MLRCISPSPGTPPKRHIPFADKMNRFFLSPISDVTGSDDNQTIGSTQSNDDRNGMSSLCTDQCCQGPTWGTVCNFKSDVFKQIGGRKDHTLDTTTLGHSFVAVWSLK